MHGLETVRGRVIQLNEPIKNRDVQRSVKQKSIVAASSQQHSDLCAKWYQLGQSSTPHQYLMRALMRFVNICSMAPHHGRKENSKPKEKYEVVLMAR